MMKVFKTVTDESSCYLRVEMKKIIRMAFYEARRQRMVFFFGQIKCRKVVKFKFLLRFWDNMMSVALDLTNLLRLFHSC